jgi:hypothetical protein
MALEGDLRDFQLPDILQMVALQQKTGILTVQGEQDIIAVSFLRGSVVAADALNQTVEDGLGRILVQERLVRQDLFSSIAAEHQAGGERLVDLLLMRGALSRPQLLHALRLQTMRMLVQLLRWKEGEFKFYAGEEVSFEEGFDPISVEELMMRAFDELGPALLADHAGVPAPEAVFEPALPTPPFRVHGRDPAEPEGQESARWISETESRLLAMLDGRASGRELSARIGLEEAKILFGLFRLERVGLARERARPAARPSAPAATPVASAAPSAAPVRPASIAPAPVASPQAVPGAARPLAAAAEPIRRPERLEVGGPVPAAAPGPPRAVAPRLQLAARLLAAGLFGALVVLATWRPLAVPLPFPWQEAERGQIEKARRTALVLAMDRVARAHFLLEGRYPDGLDSFLDLGLLGRIPRDPSGYRWEYRPGPVGYSLTPLGPDGPLADLAVNEGIPGDFLLDPEFLAFDEATKVAPLVLLD